MEFIDNNILLGAHTSISGGLDKAIIRAKKLDCTSVQIFVKNQLRWVSPSIDNNQLKLFRKEFLKHQELKRVVAHASYLINLASSEKEIIKKSIVAISHEIEESIKLGISLYVLHPGFHKGLGIKNGIKNVIMNLKSATSEYGDDIIICIETMSGQGSSLGSRFEEISEMIDGVGERGVGVCFDTCHVFSSGYDIRSQENYLNTMYMFDRIIGIEKIKVIHLNDSRADLGSHIDRHMHIGKGKIGVDAFRFIMNDSNFQGVVKIIETPKEKNPEKYDRMNLDLLRSLIDDKG